MEWNEDDKNFQFLKLKMILSDHFNRNDKKFHGNYSAYLVDEKLREVLDLKLKR